MFIVKIRETIRSFIMYFRLFIFRKILKMKIDKTARISFGAKLDKAAPHRLHIGKYTYIASDCHIMTHDFCRKKREHTYIGDNCFIGVGAIIMCGVSIGNNSIVGAGSIVTKNVPANCIVAGNPAIIIRKDIKTVKYGQLIN